MLLANYGPRTLLLGRPCLHGADATPAFLATVPCDGCRVRYGIVVGPWLACADPAREWPSAGLFGYPTAERSNRSQSLWVVSGAPGARHLRGHLRSKLQAIGREWIPKRCHGRGSWARSTDRSLPWRKLCFGL